jgi:manganese/zinc/iron transport system substrate-binding protein
MIIDRTSFFAAAALWVFALGCSRSSDPTPNSSTSNQRIQVTATTTMVADLVKQVGGERVDVQALMGPGVDPHLYKASASDVTRLQRADVIFYSGLLLEGKMQDVFTKMARTKKYVYAVTESLPEDRLLNAPNNPGHHDPHVWFDVPLWATCIDAVVHGLSEVSRPNADLFKKRGQETKAKLADLNQWCQKRTAELPKEKRILVTSHDAFNYFGRAYDFNVVGLQGISTVEEANLAAMVKLVEFVKQNQVKAVFIESSVPPQAMNRIKEDAGVRIGGELFSDAMGAAGHIEYGYDLGTYEGMIKHNVNTIVEALR